MCACVYESSVASAYSFGLATNPSPKLSIKHLPKPDPKPKSISGPAGSGRVADLYCWVRARCVVERCVLISGIRCAVQVMAVGTGSVTAGRWSLALIGWPNCCKSFRGGWRIWTSLDLIQSQMCLRKTPQPKKSRVSIL